MKTWLIPFVAFSALTIRYLILSIIPYEILWNWKRIAFQRFRIQTGFPSAHQLWSEFKWSFITFVIFSVGALVMYPLILEGRTKVYFEISQYGWWYAVLSFFILILAHDTYFYWAHRFMHVPIVFKHVHRIHHLSINPSPLAAFSFHPLETLIEGGFFYIVAFSIPINFGILIAFLFFSHFFNTIGHLGYEFYPSWFAKNRLLGFYNSSTHHNMHHHYFNCNYGFYFNFWDKLLKTNHPQYIETFDEVVKRRINNKLGQTVAKSPFNEMSGA